MGAGVLAATAAGVLVAVLPCGAAARSSRPAAIQLRGGEATGLRLCGGDRTATVAAERAAIVATVSRLSRRAPVFRVDRCAGGRWTTAGRVRAHRRGRSYAATIDTSAADDLRIVLRGRRAVYVRVGVGEIADLKVAFAVVNVNRTPVACPTDGRRYTISGHIVGPADAIRDGGAATFYLHGAAVPEATWRMPVAGYDYGFEMARLGHVSVTVDRLGYGASPTPNGFMNCFGGQGDMAHQVIAQLRAGTYTATHPVRFARVALGGHSAGQVAAEIAAYTFGDVDALVVGGWGDPVATADDAALLFPVLTKCATGGDPKRAGEPSGYALTFEGIVPTHLFHNAEDRVVAAYIARHERDPCDVTLVAAPAVDSLLLQRVRVPVFLFYGLNDALWPAGHGARQRAWFTGSDDVTLYELADTGHMIMLGRTAPAFRARASDWLRARGF